MDSWREVLYSAADVPVAQLDRASASGAEGYRFEPCRGYFLAGVPSATRGS